MKTMNILYFVRHRGRRNIISGLFCVLLSSIAITAFWYSEYLHFLGKQGINEVDRWLKGGKDNCGVIWTNGANEEERSKCLSEISKLSQIEGLGASTNLYLKIDENGYLRSAANIQKRNGYMFEAEGEIKSMRDDLCDCIQMLSTAYGIHNFKLSQGEPPDEWDVEDGTVIFYLGSNFKDLQVGKKFVNDGVNCVIGGIFEKGQRIVDSEVLTWRSEGISLKYSSSLDNMLVMCIFKDDDAWYDFINPFTCAEGYSFVDTCDAVRSLLDRYGISAELYKVGNRINRYAGYTNEVGDEIAGFCYMAAAAVIVMLLSFQLISIMLGQKEIGVYFAFGISKKKMANILLVENIIKLTMGLMIAAVLVAGFLWITSQPAVLADQKYMFKMCFGMPLLLSFVLTESLALVSTVIPVIKLSSMNVAEIIHNGWK